MNKEFVTYEQALALKKLGFDEPCFGYFNTDEELVYGIDIKTIKYVLKYHKKDESVLAPTYQQAFSFFREKHNLSGWISHSGWYHIISKSIEINEKILSEKYEEAENTCLDKLIEIIKNK
jgi:hypothetical protein